MNWNSSRKYRPGSHLSLVPPLLQWEAIPPDIQAELEQVYAAVIAVVPMANIAGYTLWKDYPPLLTIVEHHTRNGHDVDLMEFPLRIRETDEYIDAMFRHFRRLQP